MMIIASLLNFIVFFFATRNYSHINPKEVHRRQQFQKSSSSEDGTWCNEA